MYVILAISLSALLPLNVKGEVDLRVERMEIAKPVNFEAVQARFLASIAGFKGFYLSAVDKMLPLRSFASGGHPSREFCQEVFLDRNRRNEIVVARSSRGVAKFIWDGIEQAGHWELDSGKNPLVSDDGQILVAGVDPAGTNIRFYLVTKEEPDNEQIQKEAIQLVRAFTSFRVTIYLSNDPFYWEDHCAPLNSQAATIPPNRNAANQISHKLSCYLNREVDKCKWF